MTPAERMTLRVSCEAAIERAKGQQAQPVVPMLPAAMVLWLLAAADQRDTLQSIPSPTHPAAGGSPDGQ